MAIERAKKPRLVLVVEDEESVRVAVKRILETYGHKVVTASSGEEGFSIFDEGRFDLVLTDITLPGISGWELAGLIKEKRPGAPVVTLSGWDVEADKAKSGLVDRMLSKPIKVKEIIEAIEVLTKKDTEDK